MSDTTPQSQQIEHIQADAREQLAKATTLDELRAIETTLLGKKSRLNELRQSLGSLDADARRTLGQTLNAARESLVAAVGERRAALDAEARRATLEADRLVGHLHLVTQAMEELEDVFVGMGFTVAEGPEVETDWHNFGALNFPEGHPARDMYDTLYVKYGRPMSTLLRTHTSPVQIRVMTSGPPPYYCIVPGRVFRSDTADATHMPVFHQLEGLVIDRDITFADLAGTIDAFTKAYFGGDFASRLRPSYLRNCDLDPEEWLGFAFGFGVDRLAIARHGVEDLRDLFTNDIRFLTQF